MKNGSKISITIHKFTLKRDNIANIAKAFNLYNNRYSNNKICINKHMSSNHFNQDDIVLSQRDASALRDLCIQLR